VTIISKRNLQKPLVGLLLHELGSMFYHQAKTGAHVGQIVVGALLKPFLEIIPIPANIARFILISLVAIKKIYIVMDGN